MAGEKEYKRLSRARYWFRLAALYQAKDHLLLVQNTGFSEEYKRFYFRDIQAVLLRPSERLLLWSAALALLGLGSGWLAFTANGWHYLSGLGFLWFIPAFFLFCLGLNLLLGASCVCHLKTGIQTVELPITRFRQAGKIITQLRPLIEQVQRDLPFEQFFGSPAPSSNNPGSPAQGEPSISAASKPFRAGAHWAFFSLMVLASILEVTRFFHLSLGLFLAERAVWWSVVITFIVALGRQSREGVPSVLRKITVGSVFFLVAYYIVALIAGFYEGFHRARGAFHRGEWIKGLAAQPPDDTSLHLFLSGTLIVGGLLFGLLGLVELSFIQKRQR